MWLILIIVTYKQSLCILVLSSNNSRIKAFLESFLKCSSSLIESEFLVKSDFILHGKLEFCALICSIYI